MKRWWAIWRCAREVYDSQLGYLVHCEDDRRAFAVEDKDVAFAKDGTALMDMKVSCNECGGPMKLESVRPIH